MATAILPQPTAPTATNVYAAITKENVAAALRELRLTYRNDKRRQNALKRAELELTGASLWYLSADGETLKMQSSTDLETWYTITRAGCNCDGGKKATPCRHFESFETLQTAIRIARQRGHTERRYTDAQYHDNLAALNAELF